MTWELQEQLARLEPCGFSNPHPLFLSRDVGVQHDRAVGSDGKHLKITFVGDGRLWDGIAFRQGDRAGKLADRVDVVYRFEVNEWDGRRQLQLNVQDIRPAGQSDAGPRLEGGTSPGREAP